MITLPPADHPFWVGREVVTCAACEVEFVDAVCRKRKVCSQECAVTLRSGPGAHNYNGGLHRRKSDGRLEIMCRDGTHVMFYRAVMEAHLKRRLRSDEQVHHLNGDCTDDRLENLQLISASEHTKLHAVPAVRRRWDRVRKYAWSTEYPACTECGTTERRYVGQGRCSSCYYRDWRRKQAA